MFAERYEFKPYCKPLYHADTQTVNVRVVDPYEDEHVWALVDDCCNSSCHSEKWHEDAKAKWAKLGYTSALVSSQTSSFGGVGERTTSGKYRMPIGLKLKESELVIPGSLTSHEISGRRTRYCCPSDSGEACIQEVHA